MVATPINPQRLSARDDDGDDGSWGPLQIATPVIVGGVLLLILVVYVIWQRKPAPKRPYDYHQVRSAWVTKIERMFVPRRSRMRLLHSSAPMTLDDSMHTPSLTLDFRRARQYRSGSSDSQTPLTSTNYGVDYPPNKSLSGSPQPTPERRTLHWWWLFGSRPKEIRSSEPGSQWRIDGPDGSSSGHGCSSNGQGEHRAGYAALEALPEGQENGDDVIWIGGNFGSIASTLLTHNSPEQTHTVRGLQAAPEHTGSPGHRTPVPVANAIQSHPSTPMFSANRELPPSYDLSQSRPRHALAEDVVRLPQSDPSYMVIPPPIRTAITSSPRMFHGRELSTDSFLATQPPMVATSIY